MPRLARRLLAPAPTSTPRWHRRADVVVVGSGVAGLSLALSVARRPATVLVITKGGVDAGATPWAQGGIAAALARADSPAEHVADTLAAGAGLCDPAAVEVLAEEGPRALARLIALGAVFDANGLGDLALTREGGHGRARIVHAGGDATGLEVQRALVAAAARAGVEVMEHAFVLDALTCDGAVRGVVVAASAPDGSQTVGVVEARAVVLAAGGIGQVYASSTNPPSATGDGLAMALRAGAALADIEFVQFHPTVLHSGPASGQQLLISEAVRGEGAVLVDATGAPVMAGHPLGDLAPRDVVARAMGERMAQAPGGIADHLFLDARALGRTVLESRFPTIVARCRALGIDPVVDPIPVAPGAHFGCGGVRTDRLGRTDVAGLFAIGEVACTGVHGANRLASNSLLEGLVYGERVGSELARQVAEGDGPDAGIGADAAPAESIEAEQDLAPAGCRSSSDQARLAAAMSEHAGLLRSGEGLEAAAAVLATPMAVPDGPPTRADWEATNVHAVATVLVEAARRRTESRGCHWRRDFGSPDDRWRLRQVARLGDDGELQMSLVPVEGSG